MMPSILLMIIVGETRPVDLMPLLRFQCRSHPIGRKLLSAVAHILYGEMGSWNKRCGGIGWGWWGQLLCVWLVGE